MSLLYFSLTLIYIQVYLSMDRHAITSLAMKFGHYNLFTKVRSCYRVSITSNQAAKKILLEVKTITKSPENGIAESVKSCNLHQKGRILWF